jgi:eukaryotic-like serine/threonine-protein kinase
MNDPTANNPAGPIRTRAAADTTDETEISTGTLEAAFAITSPPARLTQIEAGQRLDDFDLLVELGSGAFARVFLARQLSLQRLVAVKISASLDNEPQTLAQLDHDYIVRVFDQRIIPDRKWRLLYMEYLPGGTLLDLAHAIRGAGRLPESGRGVLDAVDGALQSRGEIPLTDSSTRTELAALSWPETVAWLGTRLAEALHYAALQGVLHRDIKPANVLLAPDGTPKLADFNISFARNVSGASPFTYFGGSLSYMSPEQLMACRPGRIEDAADLDTRSDIYSLAVVLWELLTGRKPFDDSAAQAARARSGGSVADTTALELMLTTRTQGISPAALAELPPNCPDALRGVLLKALCADRDQRWASGAELAEQLQLCLDPRARDLLDPPARSWRRRLRPFFLLIGLLAFLIPNGLAAVYTIQHNQHFIVSKLSEQAQDRFILLTAVLNLSFWPLGIALAVYWVRYAILVPRRLRHGPAPPAAAVARARHDSLVATDRVVFVVFGMWLLAGLIFALALQFTSGGIPGRAAIHFVWSNMVCGAIGVAYPFFLFTFYIVRCVYPELIAHGQPDPGEAEQLSALSRRQSRYLAVAASVPLLGIAAVSVLTAPEVADMILAIRVLCIGGIVAFVFVYWLSRQIESDVHALKRAIRIRAPHAPPPAAHRLTPADG